MLYFMACKTSAISRHNTRYDNAIKAKDDDGGFLWDAAGGRSVSGGTGWSIMSGRRSQQNVSNDKTSRQVFLSFIYRGFFVAGVI